MIACDHIEKKPGILGERSRDSGSCDRTEKDEDRKVNGERVCILKLLIQLVQIVFFN